GNVFFASSTFTSGWIFVAKVGLVRFEASKTYSFCTFRQFYHWHALTRNMILRNSVLLEKALFVGRNLRWLTTTAATCRLYSTDSDREFETKKGNSFKKMMKRWKKRIPNFGRLPHHHHIFRMRILVLPAFRYDRYSHDVHIQDHMLPNHQTL
ncbi:hypothetical protein Tcan_18471, partial [Toxocara canis]